MLGVSLDQVTSQQRSHAKSLNYGLIYGMGAEGLANRINSTTEEAEHLIERYFAAYAGVARWLREAAENAVRERRSRTASGRLWIYHFDVNDRQQLAALKRVGKNAPIQGTASDIFKRAMKLVDDALLNRDAQIINSIHDESWSSALRPSPKRRRVSSRNQWSRRLKNFCQPCRSSPKPSSPMPGSSNGYLRCTNRK